MPPRKPRSRSTSRNPEGSEKKTPRSRRSSIKGGSAGLPTRPERAHPLPIVDHSNPELIGTGTKAAALKQQELSLDQGVKILICRVKLPTPRGVSGHVIRRLDTDAVSASSLFRVAFPSASQEAEENEMSYIAEHYDTETAGHRDELHRLTGTWVPTADAMILAQEYNLAQYLGELISFKPGDATTPAKPVSSLAAPSSAQTEANTPTRSSKRQRTKSHDGSAVKPSVTVSQTIAADPKTGEIAETTQVTVEGEGLIGSDATVERAVADAKHLVETLQQEGTLPTLNEGAKSLKSKKRAASEVENALVPAAPGNGLFGRFFGSQDGRQIITPSNRRLIALGGVIVTGAAAAAAPYFLG